MAGEGEAQLPQSPETQPLDVREQLSQDQISHDGAARSGAGTTPGTSAHQGAVEDEMTPVMPPMRGPDDLVDEDDSAEELIDPADEITPG